MSWHSISEDSLILNIHVVPRSSRTEVTGTHGDALKVKLQAPPADGKANKALIKFLSSKLGIQQGCISIISGETSRTKRVRCQTNGTRCEKLIQQLLPKTSP